MCVKPESASVKSAKSFAKMSSNPTGARPHCVMAWEVHSCVHNDYYSRTEATHGLSRLPQVIAIQSRINFQIKISSVLNPISRRFGNDFRPLLNRAARVADRSRNRSSVVTVIRQNLGLSHSTEGTAC
jgi:hypothetical protein